LFTISTINDTILTTFLDISFKYNVENEYVEIDIERLLKYSPETIYEAWTKEDILKQWFMTSKRTNKSFEADVQEGFYNIFFVT
jgi:hypothetical protein